MKKLIPSLAILACTSFATADVIWDQIGSMDGANMAASSISASQAFEAAYSVYDIAAIDDFTLSAATDLNSVSAVIGGWNGYAGPDGVLGYYVHVYSSVDAAGADLTGDVLSIYLENGVDPGVTYSDFGMDGFSHVTLDLSGFSLDAGTYYLAVMANNEFASNGQTGIGDSDLGNGQGWQANPSGAFGFGAYQETARNFAYSLDGNAIPAPGALALLGLAGIASRRRRK